MDPEKLLVQVAKILDDLDIKYFITGGIAVSLWGRARSTLDIDIVVQLVEPQVSSLVKALGKISKAGYTDEEMAKDAIQRKGEFNFIDPETGLKVDFWIARDDRLTPLQFKRKKLRKFRGQNIYFISPEDLILNKLQWDEQSPSTKHLEDVESIIKKSGRQLDMEYLKSWAKRLGYLDILNKLLKDTKES